MISTRSWNPDRLKVAKVLLVQTYLEIPAHPSRKLQLWVLVSNSELTLSHYYMTHTEESLVLFFWLAWILPSRSPSTTFFSQKWVSFFKINCCMFNLSFLFHLDGKYPRATAPLVLFYKNRNTKLKANIKLISKCLSECWPHLSLIFNFFLEIVFLSVFSPHDSN